MERLLIIDDDTVDRMLMKRALSKVRDGTEFIELAEGFDAVKVIKEEQPLATLLDIRMPGIDGFDVLKMIREDPDVATHPVYMISGSENPAEKATAMDLGATKFWSKPGSLEGYGMLAEAINETVFG